MSLSRLSADDHEVFGSGTDLTLSLVAILVLLLSVMGYRLRDAELRIAALAQDLQNSEDLLAERAQLEEQTRVALDDVQRRQIELMEDLAVAFGGHLVQTGSGRFSVLTDGVKEPAVRIDNEASLQRISFGNHFLFRSDEHELLFEGRRVLRDFAGVLRKRLPGIKEVQIQGHADTQKTTKYTSNFDLAAQRALEVLELFSKEGGIDPARYLISATSFGEFYPVARRDPERVVPYSPRFLKEHNATAAARRLNRRIEIVLIYRLKDDLSP